MEVSGQLHAPATLPLGKSSRYPFYKGMVWPQSRSGRYITYAVEKGSSHSSNIIQSPPLSEKLRSSKISLTFISPADKFLSVDNTVLQSAILDSEGS
jgi:hypothetical protein